MSISKIIVRSQEILLIALGILVEPTRGYSEKLSMQQQFGFLLATSVIAEKRCDLPGEIQKVRNFVESFNSGFDSLHNQEDADITIAFAALTHARMREIGEHAWCIEYRAKVRPTFGIR